MELDMGKVVIEYPFTGQHLIWLKWMLEQKFSVRFKIVGQDLEVKLVPENPTLVTIGPMEYKEETTDATPVPIWEATADVGG